MRFEVMSVIRQIGRVMIAWSLLCVCGWASAEDARTAHVVIISLDGFPAYLLDDPGVPPLPTIRRLGARGGGG